MSARRRSTPPVRSYGITPWGRALAAAVETGADHRHITGARRYFRAHHVDGLTIVPGEVTAAVRGSQLEPFAVTLRTRTVDPRTVVELLRSAGRIEALIALARGEQPPAVGELIAPTESADVASSCTCPDEAPRCIHVLAVAFEVADRIDRHPTTLLQVIGTDLPELLHLARDREQPPASGPADSAPADTPETVAAAFYGDLLPPPVPLSVPAVDALASLDATALRAALRASGVGSTQLAEALDDLAELYAVLRER